jgi:glutathione S-transferase
MTHEFTLVGQLDSPYVRRVAVSAALLGIAFAQRPWSVGADQMKLREVNPLGRVPAWIEAFGGPALVESQQIVDRLDDLAPNGSALLPEDPRGRLRTREWLGLLTGVLDKGIAVVIERVFQPKQLHGSPWTRRCRDQLASGLTEVERRCEAIHEDPWLAYSRITQADVAFASFLTYLRDALPLDLAPYPHTAARLDRIEALPAFRDHYKPFEAPVADVKEATA